MIDTYIIVAIILVPLIGALLSYVFGSCHKSLAGIIATLASAMSFALVCYSCSTLNDESKGIFALSSAPWFQVGSLQVNWSLVFDQLSAVMCLLITGVGTLIHIFSIGYMAEDEGRHRFFAYLNLFLASMLVLVLGGNFPVLFIGWEGVGLCSYLLIGFWFSNPAYAKAAQKAFVMNRIADLGLLLCMFVLFYNFNTLEINSIVNAVGNGSHSTQLLTIVGALLLVGAFGKSAQIPFFTWLPDAMAGPTPVSALIHAATMVTAGIYLIARTFPIFEAAPDLKLFLAVVATATAFISATIALVQTDIKKVLAYSTVSQLGFMFIALSAGAYWVAIFHVVTHGFFKACLFLAAGSVIHGCHHEQDMQKMGGLARKMPITFVSFSLATLAIAGIAPFAGYYSKHAILEAFGEYAVVQSGTVLPLLLQIVTLTSFLTAFYMGRCWVMTFLGSYKGDPHHQPHEVSVVMWGPVSILAILSVFAGWILQEPMNHFLSKVIPAFPEAHAASFFNIDAIGQSWIGILGLLLAFIMYSWLPKVTATFAAFAQPVVSIIKRSYLLDEIYDCLIVRPLQLIGWLFWKVGDDLVIESSIQSGILATKVGGGLLAWLQSGQIRHYAALSLAGMIGLLYMLLKGF